MPGVFHSLLICLRSLTVLQPLIDLRPLLAFSPELSGKDESSRELHHNVRRGDLISKQKLALAVTELGLEVVHILDDILAQAFNCRLDIAVFLEPFGVEDRKAVEHERRFGGVYPLEDFVSVGVAWGWKESMLLVVLVAKVSLPVLDHVAGFIVTTESLLGDVTTLIEHLIPILERWELSQTSSLFLELRWCNTILAVRKLDLIWKSKLVELPGCSNASRRLKEMELDLAAGHGEHEGEGFFDQLKSSG